MRRKSTNSDFEIYTKASALGAVAGLRAFTAPALLSRAASQPNSEFAKSFPASRAAVLLGLCAAAELVGDKLPFTPDRTEPLGLAARIISGAATGGAICAARKKSVWTGAVLGAISAVAAAYAGQNARRAISAESGIPSAVIGALEDVLAIGVGLKTLED